MDLFLVIGKVTFANNADVLPKVRKWLRAASYDAETVYTIVQKSLPFSRGIGGRALKWLVAYAWPDEGKLKDIVWGDSCFLEDVVLPQIFLGSALAKLWAAKHCLNAA